MSKIEIIVVGASAGGVEALSGLVRRLPANLSAAVFTVLHFPEDAISYLPKILNREKGPNAVKAEDGGSIEPGRVYVAPPGCHMLVKRGYMRVIEGPRENGHRPAIDPLFRTAARSYGSRVAGVLLSGMLDDGVVGLSYVKRYGGTTLVQDPEDALFPSMPRNAIASVEVDYVLPLERIGGMLAELVEAPASDFDQDSHSDLTDVLDPVEASMEELRDLESFARPSTYTCPECNGTLFELTDQGLVHYRCRVGHAYTPESLEAHQDHQLEAALWEALRSLEEHLSLTKRLMDRAEARGLPQGARYYTEKVEQTERRIALLRNVLTGPFERAKAL